MRDAIFFDFFMITSFRFFNYHCFFIIYTIKLLSQALHSASLLSFFFVLYVQLCGNEDLTENVKKLF